MYYGINFDVGCLMGEAKQKRSRLTRMLDEQPWCIYCGGTTSADTIDHMPPITIFTHRKRPMGLEFPACDACNSGGRPAEQIVGMFSRIYPDPVTDEDKKEMMKILRGVNNNHPGLLEEMQPSERQFSEGESNRDILPEGGGVLNVSGPLVSNAMHCFGAKLGLALHYEQTKKIIDFAGGIAVRWFSNFEAMKGDIPDSIFDVLGAPKTLHQGKKEVGAQFSYASAFSDDGQMGFYYSTFRQSFATAAFVAENMEKISKSVPVSQVFCPGFLKSCGKFKKL